MTDIDSKACYDCRNGSCPEHGTTRVLLVEPFHREDYDPENKAYFAKLMASCRAIDPDFGMATDLPTESEPEPDYEALGYMETSYGIHHEVDAIAAVTVRPISSWLRSFMEPDENYIKDILGDTDIVDSADRDSY